MCVARRSGRRWKEHPEYFSLVKGKRVLKHGQLCLTNHDVLKLVTSNVLARIRKDPGAKFYGVSQNDWGNYCTCPQCAAVDAEEGSHAGTMVRFVNAIAEAVEKEFPNVFIETLAYQYSRKPPKKTRLRHNVVPCLCYNVRMGAFSVDYARLERLRAAKRDIAKQRELAKSLLARFDEAKTSFTKLPIRLTNSNGARGVQIRKEWRRLLAEPAENRP